MKLYVMAVLLMVICISGCARSLPPHEELNQVFKKSFDANGVNYSSKTRITNLSIPKQDENTASDDKTDGKSDDKTLKYLGAGLEIIRGISLNADGAFDMKAKKSEVIYDLRYDRDNVEVSIKFPMMIDSNTQTVYVGTSILNTIFEAAYPQFPSTKGKLVKINIKEFLKENSESFPELAKFMDKNTFSPQNADLMSNAIKASMLKSLAKLNDSSFSDQPLTEQDGKNGVERRIRVTMNQNDSVDVVVDLINSIVQAFFQQGVINKKEYDELLSLTDRKTLDGFIDKITLSMTVDVGIAQSGFVGYLETRLQLADKEKSYQLGLENVSSFSDYNAPRFSMKPETSEIVDFKKVMEAIAADKAKDKDCSDSDDSDEPETNNDAPQEAS